jgi:hypothetical protein
MIPPPPLNELCINYVHKTSTTNMTFVSCVIKALFAICLRNETLPLIVIKFA